MSFLILVLLGVAALFLIYSLFKKLIKLAFTAVMLLLLAGGIWYFWQQDPEIPDAVRQAGEEAAEKLEQLAGQAKEEAAEIARDGAERAKDKAAELIEEGAERAIDKAATAVEGEDDSPESEEEPAEEEGESR